MSSSIAAPSPDVDVVIPAHDAASTIEAAVRSALAQSSAPARVIVVADACRDATATLARAAGAFVIETDARSPGGARNVGVAAARAEVVAFLDADDVWLPSWLDDVKIAFQRHPAVALAYGGVIEEAPDGRILRRASAREVEGDLFLALLEENFLTTSAVAVRRQAALDVGMFHAPLLNAQDWDLWLRLLAAYDGLAVPGLHVRYRRVPGSVSRSPTRQLRARDDALRVIERAAALRPIPPTTLRRARARVLAFSAMRLLSLDRSRAARIDLRRALELSPYDADLWLMSLLSVVPSPWRRALLQWRRRVRLVGGQP